MVALPDVGTLVPNLDDEVLIVAPHPDGKPAMAQLRSFPTGSDRKLATDPAGVALMQFRSGAAAETLTKGPRAGVAVNCELMLVVPRLMHTEEALIRRDIPAGVIDPELPPHQRVGR